MNKIISINLKGIIFQVEEEAYDHLKGYLETLNRHFANDESRLEILDDIESRLAEMMQERLKTKAAITVADVEEIIAIMGKPSDFETEATEETGPETEKKSASAGYETGDVPKRFFRDTDNSLLGGVCSGAGHYFNVDPLWIRLGFLFLFFIVGTGFLFYIILWIIIPAAKTPTERLQMKGEKVNVDTIEKAVKDEYGRIKKNFDEYRASGKPANALQRGLGILGDIIVAFAKFMVKAIAVLLIMWAVLMFIVLVVVVIQLLINGTFHLNALVFESPEWFWVAVVATGLLVFTIIYGMISAALQMLRPKQALGNRRMRWPMRILGIASLVVLVIVGALYTKSFSSRRTFTETVSLGNSDTLVVSAFNPVYYRLYGSYNAQNTYDYRDREFRLLNKKFVYSSTASASLVNDSLWNVAEFEVLPGTKPDWELTIVKTAYGDDDFKARAYAEKIPADYILNGAKLTVNTHFYLGQNTPWRKQKIKYVLLVPAGKVIKFDPGITEIMQYSLKNRVTDPNNYGMTWQMGENGLRCLDCRKINPADITTYANTYNVADFTNVDISVPADVTITEGNTFAVGINAPTSIRDNIRVRVSGKTLKVDYDRDLFDIFDGFSSSDIQIAIQLPHLEGLEASGAANVELVNATNESLDVHLSGACNLKGTITAHRLDVELSGASSAELSGKATTVEIDASGASDIKALDLQTETCEMDLSGASHIEVNATSQVSGEASGASHIIYKTQPGVKVNVKTSGASEIEAK